ncbi:carboxypeptidase-like regulatory domain-containing protein [Flavobacterium buctense]|uniref:Carboxypeptidase-like regulatory domain-containing protein n=1 Tax=Flavobacterium buctense TaxID=1648146 RepID=A0ABU9E1Y9_9FLAO|nr:carboxypeptidase-like regulatory domain-containing protein [Flavobacterium buctense]
MTNKINISIPKPCHENWEGMTTVEKGKFCASCQKKVHDFTKASDREIVNAFQQNQNLCGRFLTTQLDRDLVKPNEKSAIWLATTATVVSLIGIGTNEVTAQEPVKTEQTDRRILGKFLVTKPTEIEVSGTVSDQIGPLPGANVFIKGTEVKAICDFDGNFTIKAKKNDILVVTYVGYNSSEIEILNEDKLKVTLKDNGVLLGEVVTGGIYIKKRTFFGRIFHSIGNWFR